MFSKLPKFKLAVSGIITKRILTLLMLGFLLLAFISAPVSADISTYQTTCSTNGIVAGCQAPQISDIQGIVAKLTLLAWASGGLLFMGLLIYNGAIYLLGSWEVSKYILGASLEDVQKRMAQWGIGLVMFFISYPVMNTVLKNITADSNCYKSLREPGFVFFFPELCQTVTITDSRGPVASFPSAGEVPKSIFNLACDSSGVPEFTGLEIKTVCTAGCFGESSSRVKVMQLHKLDFVLGFPVPTFYDYYAACDCNLGIDSCLGVVKGKYPP